jgi:uncharacterized cupredoxin-like copper-binding protein
MPRPLHLAAVLGCSLLMSAVGSDLAVAARTVHVDLGETVDGHMTVTTNVDKIKAGKVTFDVVNDSEGMEHEFLVARMNGALKNVPFDKSKDIVKEADLKDVTELGDLKPGKSGHITLDLKPGKYLLFCNMPGHYEAGMRRVLTVTN